MTAWDDPIPRRFQVVCTGQGNGDFSILASGVLFPNGSVAVGYNDESGTGKFCSSMDELPASLCGEGWTTHLVWLDFTTDPLPSRFFVETFERK